MRRILFFLIVCCTSMQLYAQNLAITGRVIDEKGEPLIGASIRLKSGTGGTTTDVNGRYSINAPAGSDLVVTYTGYINQELRVTPTTKVLDVTMNNTQTNLSDVVVVGYTQQKRVNLAGSVSQITGQQLTTTKNESVTNMLTGKIAGVRVVQKSAEPGEFNQQFDIRGYGAPLVVIDGVPRSGFERLDPNDIESVSVIKDGSAAVYGFQASNGVVLITTKKGKAGSRQLRFEATTGIQRAAGSPDVVNAVDWMTLRNEQAIHNPDILTPSRPYTPADFAAYNNGTRESGDWYSPVLQRNAPQTQLSLTASGGSENTTYYLSLGSLYQQGFWKSGDLNYQKYNVRSTVNTRIAPGLTAELQLAGIKDAKQSPYGRFGRSLDVYAALWRQSPINTPYLPGDPSKLQYVLDNFNPIALTNSDISGERNNRLTIIQSNFSLTYDMPFIKGLKAKGFYAYDYTVGDNKTYSKSYNLYAPSGTSTAVFTQGVPQVNRYYGNNNNSTLQLSLNYNHTFNNAHNVQLLGLFEQRVTGGDNFSAQRDLIFNTLDQLGAGLASTQLTGQDVAGANTFVNKGYVSQFHYDFKSRYIVEFNGRYDGSSRFYAQKQWGFFPSVSAAWNVSEENFVKNRPALAFISNFKLRGSYGITGDPGGIAFQFLTGYDYPLPLGDIVRAASGSVFNGNFIGGLGFRSLPNINLTWYNVKHLDLGFQGTFWKGLLGMEFSWFRRDRDGLPATRLQSLPGSVGASQPVENLESDRQQGLELTLSHNNRIGKVAYNISGNVTYNRTLWRYRELATAGNSYANWRNGQADRYKNIWFGYGGSGQFGSTQEIVNYPIFQDNRNLLPGDYKYEDWNGDGYINGLDEHPIATGRTSDNNAQPEPPLINFGLNMGVAYKGFDLNALFQGTALRSIQYAGPLSMAFTFPNANALSPFLDRWHPADPAADPYNPNTQWVSGYYPYTGTVPVANSAYALQNAAYVRLKTLTLGYTLPVTLTKKAGMQSVRFYLNGYNLFTVTGVKLVDPEHPSDQDSYAYPLNKTYNIGVNVTF